MPGAAWQPDDARGTCNLCDEVFSFSRRRHHCRYVRGHIVQYVSAADSEHDRLYVCAVDWAEQALRPAVLRRMRWTVHVSLAEQGEIQVPHMQRLPR
jgi:hypothetical protein